MYRYSRSRRPDSRVTDLALTVPPSAAGAALDHQGRGIFPFGWGFPAGRCQPHGSRDDPDIEGARDVSLHGLPVP